MPLVCLCKVGPLGVAVGPKKNHPFPVARKCQPKKPNSLFAQGPLTESDVSLSVIARLPGRTRLGLLCPILIVGGHEDKVVAHDFCAVAFFSGVLVVP